MNKAIFLDRDGTINYDYGYVHDIGNFRFIEDTFKGLRSMQDMGYKLFIVSNQSGVGRGYFKKENLINVHKFMINMLENNNIYIQESYYCIHKPSENCICRKPQTHFIEQIDKKYGIDLKNSYVIGDKDSDIKMGLNAGCKTIRIDDKVRNLYEASMVIKNS